MNKVRPVKRKPAKSGAREVQRIFAMQGLEGDTELVTSGVMSSEPRIPRTDSVRPLDSQPLVYRRVLADWPVEWRERWGRRANDLEASGLSWRDAEGRAFAEVWNEYRMSALVQSN
jgi:hypothetical protein